MPDKSDKELPGSIVETAVLAFELVGDQIGKSPQTLARIIQSPAVQSKIKEALEKNLRGLQEKAITGRPIDSQQAQQAITSAFTKSGLDAVKKGVTKSVEQSAGYRKLHASLKQLTANFKDRPLGVFIDEPEGLLLIVVAGAFVAGAAGIYIAETGDSDGVINQLSKLAEKPTVKVLGKVELSATEITVKPSEKIYSGGIAASVKNWKAVKKADFRVVVQKKSEKVAALPMSVSAEVQLAPNWIGRSSAGLTLDRNGIADAKFSLGIESKANALSIQIMADATLQPDLSTYGATGSARWKATQGVTVFGSGEAKREVNRLTDEVQQDYRINVGLSIDL